MSSNRRGEADTSLWDHQQAQRYAAVKHGPDGARFLDPHLDRLLIREQLADHDVLDLGAGTGPWSAHALKQGARSVTALDLNSAMLAQARQLLTKEGELPKNVTLIEANVAQVPLADESFNRILSINVGCNLPVDAFGAHFAEAHRVARNGGRFVVTAPNSLTVPFTNGSQTRDIQQEVDERWNLEADKGPQGAKRVIGVLISVLRATFVLDADGRPLLITQENAQRVTRGTPILRRIPGLVVDNNFHTANEYITAAESAGWMINATHQDSFGSRADCDDYNSESPNGQELGYEYVGKPPFLIMDLEKRK